MMIRVLLFDVGGVLLHGHSLKGALREFADANGIDPEELVHLRDTWASELRIGEHDAPALFRAAGMRGDDATLLAAWLPFARRHLLPNTSLMSAMQRWRAKGLRTAILSNLNQLRASLDEVLGIYEGSDPVLLSRELGVMKPDPAIYALALAQLEAPANEIVFIDDSEENLPPARALGMHTILFTDNMALVRDLAALGVS